MDISLAIGEPVSVGVSIRSAVILIVSAIRATHLDLRNSLTAAIFPRSDGGQEVDEEAEYPEGEDERNDPFENGCLLLVAGECQSRKADCKYELDDDEHKLDPKACSQYGVLTHMDAQSLVFGASEDSRYDISRYEQEQEAVVEMRVPQGVEDREKNQTRCPYNRKQYPKYRKDLFTPSLVAGEHTSVS